MRLNANVNSRASNHTGNFRFCIIQFAKLFNRRDNVSSAFCGFLKFYKAATK